MWIVILNFCLFLLLLGFFFYGLKHWSNLISEPDEKETEKDRVVDGRNMRLPLWLLIVGLGSASLLKELIAWLGY